jgi:hypothetical protein
MGIQLSDQSTAALRAHQATIIAADQTRQSVLASAAMSPAGQAAVRAADVAFHRTLLASARSNGVDAGPFVAALAALGTGGN